jgi:hypothetical protein
VFNWVYFCLNQSSRVPIEIWILGLNRLK